MNTQTTLTKLSDGRNWFVVKLEGKIVGAAATEAQAQQQADAKVAKLAAAPKGVAAPTKCRVILPGRSSQYNHDTDQDLEKWEM